jgi:RNA polymerase sigma-70 factor (ECF subfamily)
MRGPGVISDARLLVETPADPQAFAEFYRRHERAVLAYLVYWCRSADVAADLMAETFAAAFESAARFDPELGEARAWLFGIARHVLARSLRRARVEDDARRRLGLPRLVVDDQAMERVEALVSDGDVAIGALEGLSELLRSAVEGRVIDEREYRELAQALRCSQSVVRQRVRRGLAQMRDRLGVPQ